MVRIDRPWSPAGAPPCGETLSSPRHRPPLSVIGHRCRLGARSDGSSQEGRQLIDLGRYRNVGLPQLAHVPGQREHQRCLISSGMVGSPRWPPERSAGGGQRSGVPSLVEKPRRGGGGGGPPPPGAGPRGGGAGGGGPFPPPPPPPPRPPPPAPPAVGGPATGARARRCRRPAASGPPTPPPRR